MAFIISNLLIALLLLNSQVKGLSFDRESYTACMNTSYKAAGGVYSPFYNKWNGSEVLCDIKKFNIDAKPLSNGATAKVYKATYGETTVAMKVIPKREHYDVVRMEECMLGSIKMEEGDVPVAPKFYCSMTNLTTAFLAIEYIEGESLHSLYMKNSCDYFMAVLESIGYTLDWLHGMGIMHHDVKAENIMIDVHGQPRLIDYGFSTLSNATFNANMSTLFASPELLKAAITKIKVPTTFLGMESIDWYALGVTLYEMCETNTPLIPKNITSHVGQIKYLMTGFQPSFFDKFVDKAALYKGLLSVDPQTRWKWANILNWINKKSLPKPSAEEASVKLIEFNEYGWAFDHEAYNACMNDANLISTEGLYVPFFGNWKRGDKVCNINDFTVGHKVLGKGVSSSVKLAYYDKEEKATALKVINWSNNSSTAEGVRAQECMLGSIITAEGGVPVAPRLYCVTSTPQSVYLAMELIEGKNLAEKKLADESRPFLLPVLYRIGTFINWFQENNLKHGDIKLANIIIDESGNPRLVDFKYACRLDSPFKPRFTLKYVSPELLKELKSRSATWEPFREGDWYELGFMAFEMSENDDIVPEKLSLDAINYLKAGISTDFLNKYDHSEMYKGLLCVNPVERWKWPQLKEWITREQKE